MYKSNVSERERTASSVLIAIGIFTGLLFPSIADLLIPYALTALFLIVVFSLNTHSQDILDVIRKPDAFTGLFLLWQMAGIPLRVTVICVVLDCSMQLTAILIAVTTAGSVFASPAIVHVIGLNRQIAIRGMILSTCMMPVSLLVFGELNGILPPDLSFVEYSLHIAKFIILPLMLSAAFWRVRLRMTRTVANVTQHGMHWASTAAVLVFCVGMMSEIHRNYAHHADELVFYAVLSITLTIIMYAITVALFYRYGPDRAMTAGLLAANRNVALSFALMSSVFPPAVMTFVAVAQFPIFLAPMAMRMWNAVKIRHTDKAISQ